MIKALFTSATGLAAQQTVVDSTSNNLANVNTTGFKRSQPDFQDLIYVTETSPGASNGTNVQSPVGLQVGSGVRISGNTKVFTPGTLDNTSNPLDVAIEGDGFFSVTLPSGDLRYTRDGSFHIDSQGNLVTSDGYKLNPSINIPQNAVSVNIGVDGAVSAQTPGSTTQSSIAQLTITRFPNPAGLSSQGGNLYAETPASGAAISTTAGQQGAGNIRQGFLERSNVEVVRELVNLILAQRAYEFNTRAIRAADDMLSYTNNLSR
jgi:flagellar basal-body rod protein FlgG